MSPRETFRWSKLDNAAKIFPSTAEKSDTRVFRFACTLRDPVDPSVLQRAVLHAVRFFPHYLSVIRKGAFWYYLERRQLEPVVEEEHQRVCAPLLQNDQKKLLFQVSYYKRRINLEMHHVLSDGTGAMQFLKAIVTCYLNEKYKDQLSSPAPVLEDASSLSQRTSDSFQKYYQKSEKGKKNLRSVRAYTLKGERLPDDSLMVLEGIAQVSQVLQAAHAFHTTMTVYLTAVLMEAIHREMDLRSQKSPVVVRIPVNLRQFFPSQTAKNFFGMMEVHYDFSGQSGEFEDQIRQVSQCFQQELNPQRLARRMNAMADLEHNPFVRIAPLPVKDVVLRQARHMSDTGETMVLSNVGRVTMPEELTRYIQSFHVFASTKKTQLCVCSFEDQLQLGFTSAFAGTDLQRQFLSILRQQGIELQIASNTYFSQREEGDHAVL